MRATNTERPTEIKILEVFTPQFDPIETIRNTIDKTNVGVAVKQSNKVTNKTALHKERNVLIV